MLLKIKFYIYFMFAAVFIQLHLIDCGRKPLIKIHKPANVPVRRVEAALSDHLNILENYLKNQTSSLHRNEFVMYLLAMLIKEVDLGRQTKLLVSSHIQDSRQGHMRI